MSELVKKRCVPCEGGVDPLNPAQAKHLMHEIPEWSLDADSKVISREFAFKDFAKALEFVNKVGGVVQEQWHHPDIELGWGRVKISFTTHSIRGLSENDFITAAHIDLLWNSK